MSYLSKYIYTIIYILLIVCVYVLQIQPIFSYSGMTVNDGISNGYLFFLILSILFILILSPNNIYLPSTIFSWLIFNLVFVPSVIISYVSGIVEGENHIVLTVVLSLSMACVFLLPRLDVYSFVRVSFDNKSFNVIAFFVGLVCYLVLFIYYKPNISSILGLTDISQLYDIRDDFREHSSNAPTVARYIFAWTSKIFIPFLFIYGLVNKNKSLIIISLATGLLMFSATGLKSIILGPLVVYVFWKLLTFKNIRFSTLSFILVVFLLISSTLSYFGSDILNYIIVRRVVIVPGFLTGCYFDFFSNHDFALLGYSILSSFVEYPYQDSPPYIIGEYYFGRSDMSANANFMASAFSDFGIVGCILFSIFIGGVFGLLDRVALDKSSIPEISALLLLPTWTLVDTALFTSLLTHGLAIIIAIVIVMPSNILNNKTLVDDEE